MPPSDKISEDARLSLTIDNAGGRSDISEMYSIDYWIRIHGASDVIFETEVEYWIRYTLVTDQRSGQVQTCECHGHSVGSKMVDFICTVESSRVGVSVSRAMGYPHPDRFTAKMAARLLYPFSHHRLQ